MIINNKTNYHTHCDFCDGKAPMEMFVQEAIKQGMTSYGVSSHAPFPFPNEWCLAPEKVDDYIAEFHRLKEKYGERIDLYLGLEIDYLNDELSPAGEYYKKLPLDYRIGSVHFVIADDGTPVDTDGNPERFISYVNTYFQGNIIEVVIRFFEQNMKMIEQGGFDFMGHPDKISFNGSHYDVSLLEQKWYDDIVQDYYRYIASKKILIEVNTKAWERNRFLYPNLRYFKLLNSLHIPVVVNADTHVPEAVNSGRDDALKALLESGYNSVYQIVDGDWKSVPIVL